MVDELILPDFKADKHEVVFNNSIFASVNQLGYSVKCDATVYEVLLKDGAQNRRVAITQEMFRILRGQSINNAIVAFANADKRNYRLSLLTSKYEFDGNKVVKVLSNPRRYSYSLGYGTKTKTAYDFLISKGKVHSLEELIGRFSIEIVNKHFYNEIALSFTKLIGGKRESTSFEKELNLYGVTNQNKYAEFAVRLIGRIVFCWFLKEKKSEAGIPLVPENMLSIDAIKNSTNYYHDVLEPLFFELLNTNQNRRKNKFINEDYYKQIPYLNGGLFSPHVDDRYKFDMATGGGQYGVVTIENGWFEHFIGVLSQYNFTVDENTSYDIELSIDPEMLGRIFENLLAEINPETGENAKKSTGSFYTPRDIVDYMVDNSILEYLKTKTGLDETRIKALISYSKEDDDIASFTSAEKKAIISALYTVTVLDPACGSGAFPIGMLQKIVYMLQEIDPEANLWFDEIVKGAPIYVRKAFEEKFSNGELDYIRKLTVIEKSIYGVDIQPIAVEIARLRCFLSLVIEQKVNDALPNRGVHPLPSLDFKFLIANSLVKLPDDSSNYMGMKVDQLNIFENVSHIDELKAVREEYFNADNERKAELREEFADIQKKMFQQTLSMAKNASPRYSALSNWSPFKNEPTDWFDAEWMFGVKDGFDIVIGNPPYVQIKQIPETDKKRFIKNYKFATGRFNLFYLFVELASRLVKEGALTTYIVPDRLLLNTQCDNIRKWLINEQTVLEIICFGEGVFDTAIVDSIILSYKNSKNISKNGVKVKVDVEVGKEQLKPYKEIKYEDISNSSTHQIDINYDNASSCIKRKMFEKSVTLSSISEIKDGIIQSKIPDLLFLDSAKDEYSKPLLFGRDINRFVINYNGYYVNYNEKEMKAAEISRLKPGGAIGLRLRTPEIFERAKILTRQTADEIIAALDYNNYYYSNTLHGTTIINDKYNEKFVLGVMNSKIITWYYRNSIPETGKVFAQIKIALLGTLPIIDINKISEKDVELIVNQVEKLMKNGDDIEAKRVIDEVIYRFYGLTPEEIALVEESVK